MDIDWGAEVVDQLESHWRHQLRPRLNLDPPVRYSRVGDQVSDVGFSIGP